MKTKYLKITNHHGWAVIFACGFALATLQFDAEAKEEKIKDSDISHAVEGEYLFDSGVPYHDVDVETKQGIVMLKGGVENILAKDRAELIAETVRGVRSVINLINVMPRKDISGSKLKADVEQALLYDPAAESYEIDVEADDSGKVTLTGTVDSWQEKELSATVAKGVRGVTTLVNNLTVDYTSDRTDSEIQAEVESRLKWHAYVDDSLIDVKVDNSDVSLSGTVGSAAEKRQAHMAAWVRGVTSVDDLELEVERWARDEDLRKDKYATRSDEEIEKALRSAFVYDPRVFSFNVDPKVSRGLVTLRGLVDNAKAKQAAEKVARSTVGVTSVSNRLKVRLEEKLTDNQIKTNVERQLALDPWIESYEIDVSVDFGTATLRGNVDSAFEKSQAETVVYGAKGVKQVNNYLTVDDNNSVTVYDPYLWSFYPVPWHFYPYYTASVKLGTTKADSEIKDEIESEFFWSPFVDGDNVDVSVADGVATLKGTVSSLSEKDAALENAWEGGAIGVENKLEVE